MSKSALFLVILLLLIPLSFLAFKYLSSYNAPPVSSPLKTNDQNTQQKSVSQHSLYLSPNLLNLSPNTSASVSVMLDNAQASPTLVQLEIGFDPQVLASIDIVPGPFLKNPKISFKKIDYNTGRISYAIEATAENTQQTTDPIATLSFIALGSQKETTLYFLPKTVIKTQENTDSLKAAYGAKIILH